MTLMRSFKGALYVRSARMNSEIEVWWIVIINMGNLNVTLYDPTISESLLSLLTFKAP